MEAICEIYIKLRLQIEFIDNLITLPQPEAERDRLRLLSDHYLAACYSMIDAAELMMEMTSDARENVKYRDIFVHGQWKKHA